MTRSFSVKYQTNLSALSGQFGICIFIKSALSTFGQSIWCYAFYVIHYFIYCFYYLLRDKDNQDFHSLQFGLTKSFSDMITQIIL